MTNSESCEHRRWTVSANDTVGNGTCLDCHQSVPLYFLFQGLRERMEAALAALTPAFQYAGGGGSVRFAGGGGGGAAAGNSLIRVDNSGLGVDLQADCRAQSRTIEFSMAGGIHCATCGASCGPRESLRCKYSRNPEIFPSESAEPPVSP